MKKTIVLYNWRIRDPVSGRFYTTRYKATEETIRKEHPEAVAVESTREERVADDDRLGHSTAQFMGEKKP